MGPACCSPSTDHGPRFCGDLGHPWPTPSTRPDFRAPPTVSQQPGQENLRLTDVSPLNSWIFTASSWAMLRFHRSLSAPGCQCKQVSQPCSLQGNGVRGSRLPGSKHSNWAAMLFNCRAKGVEVRLRAWALWGAVVSWAQLMDTS